MNINYEFVIGIGGGITGQKCYEYEGNSNQRGH